MLNNLDIGLSAFCRKEMPVFNRLREASDRTIPERLPIRPGIYHIKSLRFNLDKFPLLNRGFNTRASIAIHKNGRVLSKFLVHAIYN